MNDKKLKELQERLILVVVDQSRFSIECTELSDLIKYVRQLEKDNAELEGLLKRVEPMTGSGLYREITEALWVVKESKL